MYDLIRNIIGYSGTYNMDSTVVYICGVVILLLTVVFIDLTFKVFRACFRGIR